MMITIDPNEMAAASETLHNCAVEAADIGSRLSGYAAFAMPPDVQNVVDQFVVTVDQALDEVAARLDAQATDLARRAEIAANDSLAAAGVVVGGTAVSAASGGPSVDGWSPDAAAWMAPMAAGATSSGGFPVDTGSWTDPMSAAPSGSGGFPTYSSSWMGAMDVDNAGSGDFGAFDKGSWVNSIHGGGGGNGAFINSITNGANNNRIAMDLGAINGQVHDRWFAPTRAGLSEQLGYAPTDGWLALFHPETLDIPNSQISL
jgi:hypothetical protein